MKRQVTIFMSTHKLRAENPQITLQNIYEVTNVTTRRLERNGFLRVDMHTTDAITQHYIHHEPSAMTKKLKDEIDQEIQYILDHTVKALTANR